MRTVGTIAYLVIKNDSLLHESYFNGYPINVLNILLFPLAKSIKLFDEELEKN